MKLLAVGLLLAALVAFERDQPLSSRFSFKKAILIFQIAVFAMK